jgi:YHS domain-containing protein
MSTADTLAHTIDRHQPAPETVARDPVCGLSVEQARTRQRAAHAGHSYYSCGARCRDRFIAEPARYISPDQIHHEPAVSGETLWTCPMHPQIIRTEPGSCPICGIALEPMTQPGRRPKTLSFATRPGDSWSLTAEGERAASGNLQKAAWLRISKALLRREC